MQYGLTVALSAPDLRFNNPRTRYYPQLRIMVASGVTKTSLLGVVAVVCENCVSESQALNHLSSSSCITALCRFGNKPSLTPDN